MRDSVSEQTERDMMNNPNECEWVEPEPKPQPKPDKHISMNVRTVSLRGTTYVRIEDVANLFLEFGRTEETDVRNRCAVLAQDLIRMGLQ